MEMSKIIYRACRENVKNVVFSDKDLIIMTIIITNNINDRIYT